MTKYRKRPIAVEAVSATTRHAIEDRLSAAIDAIDDLLNSTTVARDKALALRGAQDKQALLARIDADAIVARIFGAIAGGEFIILGEREAVRAIVCDAVTAGQDAGIEIARLQREHRAKHAAEQVDGCAMLRELGTDPARWADACASILISIVGDPSKNEGHTAAREALLGWFANAMSVAGDQARAERMRLGPTAVRYASGLEDGELADAVANGIVRYLEDGTASVATPQGTVTARSGDWIVRDYQHHYHVASSTRPAIAGAERPLIRIPAASATTYVNPDYIAAVFDDPGVASADGCPPPAVVIVLAGQALHVEYTTEEQRDTILAALLTA